MGCYRLTSLKRTLRSSCVIRHYLFKWIIPSSFICICILLFLKINNVRDDRSPVFIHKTPESKLWDDVIKSGVTISNMELFKKAMLVMRGDYLNSSERLSNFKTFSQINSSHLENKPFRQLSEDGILGRRTFNSSDTENIRGTQSTNVPQHSENTNFEMKQKTQPVIAVILVISRPSNVLLRLAARKTWARDAELYRILVRFVIGRQEDWSDIVDRESSMHKDVIIFDEDDVEGALPSKVIKGFEWVFDIRPVPIYVMKIDDDTIVNLPYLTKELLRQTIVGASQIVGSVREKVPVNRDLQNDKWAVSMLDYPSSTFPTYVFGGGYVMRVQTAKTLLEKRFYTYSWVHLEDVYLTGFVAAKAEVSHKHHRGFASWDSDKATACDFFLDRRINSINNTEEDFYQLYKGIQFLLRSKNKNYCN